RNPSDNLTREGGRNPSDNLTQEGGWDPSDNLTREGGWNRSNLNLGRQRKMSLIRGWVLAFLRKGSWAL
ncbi:MAG: hypothetical protein ABW185_16645, partial [Sedimenticola sp.]